MITWSESIKLHCLFSWFITISKMPLNFINNIVECSIRTVQCRVTALKDGFEFLALAIYIIQQQNTKFIVDADNAQLYYYCASHSVTVQDLIT